MDYFDTTIKVFQLLSLLLSFVVLIVAWRNMRRSQKAVRDFAQYEAARSEHSHDGICDLLWGPDGVPRWRRDFRQGEMAVVCKACHDRAMYNLAAGRSFSVIKGGKDGGDTHKTHGSSEETT